MNEPNKTMIKSIATALDYECIEDGHGMVCVRPMLFDGEGRRMVRYRPDACEYVSYGLALKKLMEVDKERSK